MLVDNHGYASIGALSRSVGSAGFGTHYRYPSMATPRSTTSPAARRPRPPGPTCCRSTWPPMRQSLGARVIRAETVDELRAALADARRRRRTGRHSHRRRPLRRACRRYDGWWDVPVAEVSEQPAVRAAREGYEQARTAQRIVSGRPLE